MKGCLTEKYEKAGGQTMRWVVINSLFIRTEDIFRSVEKEGVGTQGYFSAMTPVSAKISLQ